jgi:ABC-2 type transport system ATP-binding protein
MIEADHLTRRFGRAVAVDDVSLVVPEGTLLALLGPNGAGKTTTVRMLAGLLAPTLGSASVAGRDVRLDPAGVRARVGLVTDTPGLHDQMTPNAYLDFFGQVYGLPADLRRRRIAELLDLLDLRAVASSRMARFSRGMQQKVALARALLHEPSVVFLDEPTAGLDPLAARAVRELIVGLKHARRAIVLCTHDLDEAERLADLVAILRHGRIVACDTPRDLRAAASRECVVEVQFARQTPLPGPHTSRSAAGPGSLPIDLARLHQGKGVVDPSFDDSPSPRGPVLRYRTASPDQTNPWVIQSLTWAGAAIVSVTCTTASLEDVYTAALRPAPETPLATTTRRP